MSETIIPDWLVEYFTERQRDRAEAVAAVVAGLTEREAALVREAAVMGYVRGTIHGTSAVRLGRDEQVPGDRAIVGEVVDACIAMADRFPLLAGRGGEGDTR